MRVRQRRRRRRSYGAFANAQIVNPKRYADVDSARGARLFSYYAGYSSVFASTLLASLALPRRALLLDPWNGSGITTYTARRFGFRSLGQDLNPVMILISRAELLSPSDVGCLVPLADGIVARARAIRVRATDDDPLAGWFDLAAVSALRSIEEALALELGKASVRRARSEPFKADSRDSVLSFFYVVLFEVARKLLSRFRSSNPTWIKRLGTNRHATASREKVRTSFAEIAKALTSVLAVHSFDVDDKVATSKIRLGDSRKLDIRTASVDMVLSSPPYCTRIDYAVATAVELAILGVSQQKFFDLRRNLIGTSAIESRTIQVSKSWGETCRRFLLRLRKHRSKASATYYYKNHLQYFDALYRSIGELSRVLKKGGLCAIVMQDSYYKNILNNVPQIVIEMARFHGLTLDREERFVSLRSMATLNKKASSYVRERRTTESVLCFTRR